MRVQFVLVALALTAATACAKSAAPPQAPQSAAIVPDGQAKIGDRTKCPVSGDVFVVSADSPKVEYQGKTYYFCCADCPRDFQKNPAKYVHA